MVPPAPGTLVTWIAGTVGLAVGGAERSPGDGQRAVRRRVAAVADVGKALVPVGRVRDGARRKARRRERAATPAVALVAAAAAGALTVLGAGALVHGGAPSRLDRIAARPEAPATALAAPESRRAPAPRATLAAFVPVGGEAGGPTTRGTSGRSTPVVVALPARAYGPWLPGAAGAPAAPSSKQLTGAHHGGPGAVSGGSVPAATGAGAHPFAVRATGGHASGTKPVPEFRRGPVGTWACGAGPARVAGRSGRPAVAGVGATAALLALGAGIGAWRRGRARRLADQLPGAVRDLANRLARYPSFAAALEGAAGAAPAPLKGELAGVRRAIADGAPDARAFQPLARRSGAGAGVLAGVLAVAQPSGARLAEVLAAVAELLAGERWRVGVARGRRRGLRALAWALVVPGGGAAAIAAVGSGSSASWGPAAGLAAACAGAVAVLGLARAGVAS